MYVDPVTLTSAETSALIQECHRAIINSASESKQWSETNHVPFVDLVPTMSDGGVLQPKMAAPDGMHINAAGYAAVRVQLKPRIQELCTQSAGGE